MDSPTRRWQCINGCNTFETVGIPTFCPFCGSREAYPASDDVELVENKDEVWINEHE